MHARSTNIHGDPARLGDGVAYLRDEVLPDLVKLDGSVGMSVLTDRETGRCIIATAWTDRDAMRATAEGVRPWRHSAEHLLGSQHSDVQEWEIAVMHRDHRSSDGAGARVTWLRGDPTAVDRAADVFKLALMPELETFDGFCGVSLLINRDAGLVVTSVAFDSCAALESTRERAEGLRTRGSAEARLEIMEVAEFELALAHLDVPELV